MKASTVAKRLRALGVPVLRHNEGDDEVDGQVDITETIHVQVGTYDNLLTVCRKEGEGDDFGEVSYRNTADLEVVREDIARAQREATYLAPYAQAIAMMEMSADLEPTSAFKQCGSDAGIAYGDDMGKFVEWAHERLKDDANRIEAQREAPPATTQSQPEAKRPIAEFAEELSGAYSTDRYRNGWVPSIRALRARGYDDRQIEAIVRSKWTRWAADSGGKRYGHATASDLVKFVEKQSKRDLQELVDGTFA